MSALAAVPPVYPAISPIDVSGTKPRWSIDPDDMEHVTRLIAILTIHPIKSLACYFFPIFGAFTDGFAQIYKDDIGQQAKISEETKNNLFKEVESLKVHAGIRRKVDIYTGLIGNFRSYGGPISITTPLMVFPNHRVLRPNAPDFGSEVPERDNLKDNPWLLSDDETRFHIAKELALIKNNNGLIRIAVKVGIIAAAFFMYFGFVGILAGVAIGAVATLLYIISERCFQGKGDIQGVKILAKKFDADYVESGQELSPEIKIEHQIRATNIALRSINKFKEQNIARRKASYFTRLYMTPGGKNLFAVTEPFPDTRIKTLEKYRDSLIPA